jgi:malic enzyme
MNTNMTEQQLAETKKSMLEFHELAISWAQRTDHTEIANLLQTQKQKLIPGYFTPGSQQKS